MCLKNKQDFENGFVLITGDTTVFIINRWHELSGVGVEVFDLEMEDNLPVLVHKKTIKHENIYT